MAVDLSVEKQKKVNTATCKHCGDPAGKHPVIWQEHTFCCTGCQVVYELLHENGLESYYKGEKPQPGLSRKNVNNRRYDWLEEEEIMEKIIDFRDESLIKLRLHLPQIHCTSCIWLLENLNKLNASILAVKVDFLKRTAHISFDPQQLTLRGLVELLASIGYEPLLQLDTLEQSPKAKVDRKLYYQIGLAGFAFGNIMLFSFPEYLGMENTPFAKYLGYLSLLLALPVVRYSARGYWTSAWYSLQQRRLNIDIPITIGILALLGRSMYEILSHSGTGYLDSLAGLVFFLLLGKWFQQTTFYHLSFERNYTSYFPVAATVLKEGEEKSLRLDKLNRHDQIVVRDGELIPADGILITGEALIDYSFVTGESIPVSKARGAKLFAGGRQRGGRIQIQLTNTVAQSYLTQLWNDQAFSKPQKTTEELSEQVGKWFTGIIVGIALLTLGYWLWVDPQTALNAFTAVLIIACPCAIALAIPFSWGNSIRLLGKRDVYVKNTQVIEQLAGIDTIVFDKTGTLTSTFGANILYEGKELSPTEKEAVYALVSQSAHPVSKQIANYYEGVKQMQVSNFVAVPGTGISGRVGKVTVRIGKWQRGTGLWIDEEYKGIFYLKNQYRAGIEDLIQELSQHYNCYVVSGDNDRELPFLETLFPTQNLHFQQSPADKLSFIKGLQEKGEKVMMVGDGLNDAGALQQSEVGMVITEHRNNFTPASDAILDARQFLALPAILRFSKDSIRVVYFSYGVAVIYNIIGLSFAVQGLLSPVIAAILMPISSVTIVALAIGATHFYYRRLAKNRGDKNHPSV